MVKSDRDKPSRPHQFSGPGRHQRWRCALRQWCVAGSPGLATCALEHPFPAQSGPTTASGIDLASLRRDWQAAAPHRLGPPPLCVRGRPVLGSCRLISSAHLPRPIALPVPHRRPHRLPIHQTFPPRSRPPVSVCGSSPRLRRLHPPPSPWRLSAARLRAWRGPARPPSRSARYVEWF